MVKVKYKSGIFEYLTFTFVCLYSNKTRVKVTQCQGQIKGN